MPRPVIAALILAVGMALAPVAAQAGPAVTPLVSADWLEANLGASGLVVLDIRSASDFSAGHVPGAEQTDYPGQWRTTRDDIPWVLPDVTDLEALLSSLGIGNSTSVVIVSAGTDATELGGATWIYWVLKYLGHDAVAILDGGWTAWTEARRPRATGTGTAITPADFTANPQPRLLASTDEVAAVLGTDVVLVDARSSQQYSGLARSGLATRSGHIPGAINLDNASLFDAAAHRLKSIPDLVAELPPELSDRAVATITYCNTGHWGSIDWFVLHELLGFQNVRLYEGSMAAWSRRSDLPIAIGPDPGG